MIFFYPVIRCSLKPVNDGDVRHGAEAGLCELDGLDAVADDGGGGDVAVDAAADAGPDVGGPADDDGVVGFLEAVVRAELERDPALPAHKAARDLPDAAAAARGDLEEGAAHVLLRDDRVDGLCDVVQLPPHRRRDERDRLWEPDVLDPPGIPGLGPLSNGETSTNLLLDY